MSYSLLIWNFFGTIDKSYSHFEKHIANEGFMVHSISFNSQLVPLSPVQRTTVHPVRFGNDDQNPPEEPEKKVGLIKKSANFMKTMFRKVTSWRNFKAGVKAGYHQSKEDLKQVFTSRDVFKILYRVNMEVLGAAVGLLFLPMPGPNPAIFISPTTRKFFMGFIKAPLHEAVKKPEESTPEAKPADLPENKPKEDNPNKPE